MTAPITDAPITAERRAQVQRWLNAGCECETCVILRGYEALCAQLEARLRELTEAATNCASDLEGFVESAYQHSKNYPSQMLKYERDMEPVRKVKALAAMAAQTK